MIEKDPEINCLKSTQILSDSIDGYASQQEMTQLTEHLKHCDYCKVAKNQFSTMFKQIKVLLGNA